MGAIFRFITGFVVGFEIRPSPAIYLHLCLGIVEVMFIDHDHFDDFFEEVDE